MTREEAIEGINDKLKDLKYYAKEMGKVLKSTNYFIDELERQAKKEEPKPKAYHVKDEYSFNCLMKELNGKFGFVRSGENYIYEKDHGDGKKYYNWTGDFEEIKDTHEVIEYHKEEPRYLLQTNLTSEDGVQYLSFDKKRREYFMGALMTSENVQQKFTDSEILGIESITRFGKLCEKVEVEWW